MGFVGILLISSTSEEFRLYAIMKILNFQISLKAFVFQNYQSDHNSVSRNKSSTMSNTHVIQKVD